MLQFRKGSYSVEEARLLDDAIHEAIEWLARFGHKDSKAMDDLNKLSDYLQGMVKKNGVESKREDGKITKLLRLQDEMKRNNDLRVEKWKQGT